MNERIDKNSLAVVNLFDDSKLFVDKNNSFRIAFSGYLLNQKEIIKNINDTDTVIKELSDAELILELYRKYGNDCVKYLKGIFVFAIQKLEDNSLFLARDRVGGKILYYSITKDTFIFAPDLKRILSEDLIERRINKTALAQYLMLSYIPSPLSILENVYKLPAGHYLTINSNGELEIEEYWDVVYDELNKISDYGECKQLLRKTLFHAVEECMEYDKDAGVLLSGGVDSNIITGIMSKISDKPVNTFSIGCKDVKDYDESDRANLSAKFHRSNHQLFFIEYKNMLDNIEKVIDNIDEPYADSSYLPTYTISQIAGQHVKTVFTGDAGDELFAGYNKYLIGHYSSIYKKIPTFLRNGVIKPIVGAMPANLKAVRKINKVIDNSFLDTYSQRRNMMCLGVRFDDVNKLLTYDGSHSLDFIKTIYDKYESTACETDRTLYTDFKVVLEGDMLTKSNRTSELAGVVSIAPILHPDLVDLAAKIPVEYKIKAKDRKIILKDTFSDMVPDKIVKAKKTGFAVPISYWFQNELKVDLTDTLDRKIIENQGLLNPEYVEILLDEHIKGKKNNSGILWALYVFEKWYQKYFKK